MKQTLNSIRQTLSRAHELFLTGGDILSPEMIALRSTFLSDSCIRAFDDDELYLRFLENLIRERDRLSFPEEPELLDCYLADCIRLKNLQKSLPDFRAETWLEDTIRMMDTLKTPYYETYVRTLSAMRAVFRSRDILEKTLKDFYGVMLKSSGDMLPMIASIAEQGKFYLEISLENEEVIRGLLLSTLARFMRKGSRPQDLEDYLEKEKLYFLNRPVEDLPGTDSLPDLLADRMVHIPLTASPRTKGLSGSNTADQKVESEFLNRYADNMNTRTYLTDPAIGREEEIKDLSLILISPKKSPILIGEAGVGKTSVAEGLAYALQQDRVPDLLRGRKIFKLTTTSLLSGTKYVGEMEERMKKLMDELSKHPEVILFIDEIHTIVGAGSTESSNNDIANMLKPYIDRGDIKLIGATTSAEYHRFIKYDQALSRRFYPIYIEEPDRDLCLKILEGTIPGLSALTRVNNPFDPEETRRLLSSLLDICSPDRQPEDLKTHWPELPLSILEMAFSYAALVSRKDLAVEDFIYAAARSNRLKKSVRQNAGQYFVLEEPHSSDSDAR